MTLVDASVWIDHLRRALPGLATLLENGDVLTHPFVLGELVCGHLPGTRSTMLADLNGLPRAPVAGHEEVVELIERHRLAGSGLGWVDAHLLASALIGGVRLWSSDRALRRAAQRLAVAAY